MTEPSIGALIRIWRFTEKLSNREAARMIGISSSTLSRIENGKPMDVPTMMRLMVWLFGDGRQERP